MRISYPSIDGSARRLTLAPWLKRIVWTLSFIAWIAYLAVRPSASHTVRSLEYGSFHRWYCLRFYRSSVEIGWVSGAQPYGEPGITWHEEETPEDPAGFRYLMRFRGEADVFAFQLPSWLASAVLALTCLAPLLIWTRRRWWRTPRRGFDVAPIQLPATEGSEKQDGRF